MMGRWKEGFLEPFGALELDKEGIECSFTYKIIFAQRNNVSMFNFNADDVCSDRYFLIKLGLRAERISVRRA
jgi:hypothetical protein